MVHRPLRLRLDGAALAANWEWLRRQSAGASCGAAVKANGYGLGAREVVARLRHAGCRDFFVATWAEAQELDGALGDASLSVLHGLFEEDMPAALASPARPVLNTPAEVRRWRDTGRPCDVMIDTGINRLGLAPPDVRSGLLDGLNIETLHSHLACGDEDVAANASQRQLFEELSKAVPSRRRALANSAGICLGTEYALDLTRPGLALYGGIPRIEAQGQIRQVARVEVQVIQRRRVPAGGGVGYNATWRAEQDCEIAILNIGYADGYLRGFSSRGLASFEEQALPVIGRVSMDLTAVCVDAAPQVAQGDWIAIDFDLPRASERSGLSQYELLTGLGSRYQRIWE